MPATIDIMNGHGGNQPDAAIFKIVSRSFPAWGFEFHPVSRQVYAVPPPPEGKTTRTGMLLAGDISSADHARQIVQVFIAGYRAGEKGT